MAANLVEILREYITPDVISSASVKLGESESGVAKAISTSIPTLLGGLVHKSNDSETMGSIMGLINNSYSTGNILESPSSQLSGSGSGLLGLLFGNKQNSVIDGIARTSGIKDSSALSVLGMIGSIVMAYFAKSGLSSSGLTNLLSSQKDSILAGIPSGLNLGFATPVHNNVHNAVTPSRSPGGTPKWLIPLLLIAAALLAIYYFSKSCGNKEVNETVVTEPVDTVSTTITETEEVAAPQADFFKLKLPNGIELNAAQNGIENQLNTWLMDGSKAVDKTTWFNFDRLLFDTGKATLRTESQEQLKNMVEILKAYPTVELKIGGYTDNVGDPAANLKLSGDRAKSVVNEMVNMGVAASRLSAEGYGEQFPVASNDTEEGKAQNRRIAVRVIKK
jgi:OOP family OmpA-OmpF porin